jgi:hypothetical protein
MTEVVNLLQKSRFLVFRESGNRLQVQIGYSIEYLRYLPLDKSRSILVQNAIAIAPDPDFSS